MMHQEGAEGGVSMEAGERRIATIFGVSTERPLPPVSPRTLQRYHTYLQAHLALPFAAADKDGPLMVTELFDFDECPDLAFSGLFCRGKQGSRRIDIPLADIEDVQEEGKNKQLIADYCMWFWNYR